ncbi:ATP-binding protein [Nocardioides immobilis]|uniref:ATP-binding protein n=1 Tax=Nocardioides immobilis TaxID=2049295 RepID=UPI0024828DFC|nr:ATP-binding protein [Nocardioides immobilis]
MVLRRLSDLFTTSLILTSNLPFSGWGGVFGDQAVAAAMIDRIVHHADVLTLKGVLR